MRKQFFFHICFRSVIEGRSWLFPHFNLHIIRFYIFMWCHNSYITCNDRIRVSTIFTFLNPYNFLIVGLLIVLCVYVCFYKWGLKPRPCAFSALTQTLRGTPDQSSFFWLFIKPMGIVLTSLYIWLLMYDCTLKHFPFVPSSILTSPFSEFESPLCFFLFLCHGWLRGMSQFMGAFPSVCAFL